MSGKMSDLEILAKQEIYRTNPYDPGRASNGPAYGYAEGTSPGAIVENPAQGKKFDAGKAPISLIPTETILGTANVFAFGAKKYGRHNFREGLAHSRCLDAAMRHLLSIIGGEDTDPESGLPHIYHAMCSLAMYDWQRIHHPELNDRYDKETSIEKARD